MKKTKNRYFILIIAILFAFICNSFFVEFINNTVYAEEEKEEGESEFKVWSGGVEQFYLQNSDIYNSESNPYIIDTPEKLAYLAVEVNNGYNNYRDNYFKLDADLNLNCNVDTDADTYDHLWTSIGYKKGGEEFAFGGIFDGGNHKIINLGYLQGKDASYDSSYGLFGYTENAVIKNLNLSFTIKMNGKNVAGLVGYARNTTVTNCSISGTIVGTNSNVGHLFGTLTNNQDLKISNVEVLGTISLDNGSTNVGGLIGAIYNESYKLDLEDINALIQIEAYMSVGGISNILSSIGDVTLKNCKFHGQIEAHNGSKVGGILGLNPSASIQNCINYGYIKSTGNYVAGIVGENLGVITNSKNVGAITGGDYTAGIAGSTSNEISNCANGGTIKGNNYTAGIAGMVEKRGDTKFDFKCNYNVGYISGNEYVAGLVAKIDGIDIYYSFNIDIDINTWEYTITRDPSEYMISGNDMVAGLVASAIDSNIDTVFNSCKVKSNGCVAGLVATFIGSEDRCQLTRFYNIGDVVGVDVAGIVYNATKTNISYGYIASTISNASTSTNLHIIYGTGSNNALNCVYYVKELVNITDSTQGGIGVNSSNLCDTDNLFLILGSDFMLMEQSQIDEDGHYFDYYPILFNLFYNVYNEAYPNYFIDNYYVQRFSVNGAISKINTALKIKFVTNTDETLSDILVKRNTDLTDVLPTITKEGYVFNGWYLDHDLKTKLDVKNGISEDVTLYAKFGYPAPPFPWWIIVVIIVALILFVGTFILFVLRKKTISFNVEGNDIAPQKYKVGESLSLPHPNKVGCTFDGWYLDINMTNKFELNTMPNISLILFGKFIENKQDDGNNKVKNKALKSEKSNKDVTKDKSKTKEQKIDKEGK